MPAADPSDFYTVHRCLRDASAALAATLASVDALEPEPGRTEAIARYWQGFAGELVAHHTIEDSTFFPALVKRVPIAAELLGRVDDDHRLIDELLVEAGNSIEGLASGRSTTATAAGTLDRFDDVLRRHLDFEDADLIPLYTRHFEQAEYDALSKAAIKSLGIGKQALFTVPFLALGSEPSMRDALLNKAGLPFRVLYRLTRSNHARLATAAFGSLPLARQPLAAP